ncbi:globin domain-containing protein [Nocardia sp. XZ_19_231]|uniref:globin domain-containing protein n=1 Tax=Nocardia sp. XZ_19_231 TaxID=2769252 RepID=UPI00188F9226|nr:globin domain-containing protein [Nocardia sp. XZ_19_231]
MTTTPAQERSHRELDSHHAELIRATLPLVTAQLDRITEIFYRRLFDAHPELSRDLFNREHQLTGRQPRALAAAITTFAAAVTDPTKTRPTAMLNHIAAKHVSLGVTAAQYATVYEHLFAAIVEVLGLDAVTSEVKDAWSQLYWMLAEALIGRETALYDQHGYRPQEMFTPATVQERTTSRANLTEFTISAADPDRALPTPLPGQAVTIGVTMADGARQHRQFRVVATPEPGQITFAVKHIPGGIWPVGEIAIHMIDHIHTGDTVEVSMHTVR